MLIHAIAAFLLLAGLFFFAGTTVGLIRFPDFYSRMHAAGKGDTLSSVLFLLGLAIYDLHDFSVGSLLVTAKILFISVFIFIASPTATHAIMDAGYEAGVKHWVRRTRGMEDYTGPERRREGEHHT